MNTNVVALQNLYVALGGDIEDVQDCNTSVEVLNAIAAKYEGNADAILNPDAIENIAAVADNIGGTTPTGTKTITENGTYDVTEFETAEVAIQPNLVLFEIDVQNNTAVSLTVMGNYKVQSGNNFLERSSVLIPAGETKTINGPGQYLGGNLTNSNILTITATKSASQGKTFTFSPISSSDCAVEVIKNDVGSYGLSAYVQVYKVGTNNFGKATIVVSEG